MKKIDARVISKNNLLNMLDVEKEWASGAIIDYISSLDAFKKSKKIFIYINNECEPFTEELIGLSLMMEKIVSVPKVIGDDMKAIIINPYSLFKRNKWGIEEPINNNEIDDIDLSIIPMVAFDGLNRLGHGKGFYDKFLSQRKCYKIGLAYNCQKINNLEINNNDICMDMVVTEKEVITKNNITNNIFGLEK